MHGLRLALSILIAFYCSPSSALVCTFWYGMTDQSLVDAGLGNEGGCDEWPDDLVLPGAGLETSDIWNLEALSYIKHIGYGLVDEQGQDNPAPGGGLVIENNPLLESLSGLHNLKGVYGDLTIRNNKTLSDCSAIASVISRRVSREEKLGVGGTINIESNADGCNSVAEVIASANKPVSTMPFYLLMALTGLVALAGSVMARVPAEEVSDKRF